MDWVIRKSASLNSLDVIFFNYFNVIITVSFHQYLAQHRRNIFLYGYYFTPLKTHGTVCCMYPDRWAHDTTQEWRWFHTLCPPAFLNFHPYFASTKLVQFMYFSFVRQDGMSVMHLLWLDKHLGSGLRMTLIAIYVSTLGIPCVIPCY